MSSRRSRSRSRWTVAVAVLAIAFGALTIASGGWALFGGEAARAAVGNAVPFVLWFNFFSGFLYVAAGVGLYRRQSWAARMAVFIAAATLIVFLAFGWVAASGTAFEMRTVGAMFLRTFFWVAVAIFALRGPGRQGDAPGRTEGRPA